MKSLLIIINFLLDLKIAYYILRERKREKKREK